MMCEECETPGALHLTYAEKRKRISAIWKPARKTGQFAATQTPTPVTSPAGKAGQPGRRKDERRD